MRLPVRLLEQRRLVLNACGTSEQPTAAFPCWNERCKSRNGADGDVVEFKIELDANAVVSYRAGGCNRRAASHEWVQHSSFSERQGSSDKLPHEGLRFQRWVRGDGSLDAPRRRAPDHVTKGLMFSDSSQASRLPLPKVILHAAFAWFSEETPRLPARPWHDRDVAKLSMGVLWPIAASKRLHKADNLPAFLKSRLNQRAIDQV